MHAIQPPSHPAPAGARTPLYAALSPQVKGNTFYHNVLGIIGSSSASYDVTRGVPHYDYAVKVLKEHSPKFASSCANHFQAEMKGLKGDGGASGSGSSGGGGGSKGQGGAVGVAAQAKVAENGDRADGEGVIDSSSGSASGEGGDEQGAGNGSGGRQEVGSRR